MKGEDVLFALNEVDDEALRLAGQALEKKSPVRFRRHTARVLLIAAALAFALGGIGWYVVHSAISARIPLRGEKLVYHDVLFDENDEEYLQEVQISRAGMVLRADTEAESPLCLFKAPAGETLHTGRKNLYSILERRSPEGIKHLIINPEIRLGLEEGLRQAGMSRTEAVDWCTAWYLFDEERDAPTLYAELLNACELYETDLILGFRDARAETVSETETGSGQCIEVILHDLIECRYLFRYDAQKQYLLVICADSAYYDFPDLEAFADSLSIRQTGLNVAHVDPGRDWMSVLSLKDWMPYSWQEEHAAPAS